jgi:oligopeptide/dipeptide ABC transporter ATP-binding protein
MTALVDITGLTIDIDRDGGPARVMNGITLSLEQGESLGIVGESGCGKSLTMLSLVGLLPNRIRASGGSAKFDGGDLLQMNARELRGVRRSEIGFIFQDTMTRLNPVMTIGDQIAEALIYQKGITKAAALAWAEELLAMVDIPSQKERMTAYPHELSGGQRQRVTIARALACLPRFIVCDEAISALDVSVQTQILNLLLDLQDKYALTYLFIAHDLAVVRHISDRVGVMYLGRLAELAPSSSLFVTPLPPDARALLSVVPEANPRAPRNRQMLQGEVPRPLSPPPGCRFHTRCPLARDTCRSQTPALREVVHDHHVACHAVTSATTSNWEAIT